MNTHKHVWIYMNEFKVVAQVCENNTGWRGIIGSPKLQIIFYKRAVWCSVARTEYLNTMVQSVAFCCSEVQCLTNYVSIDYGAVCCSALQCGAVSDEWCILKLWRRYARRTQLLCEWVMSHKKGWHECAMSHACVSCLTWMSHVSCEWVMSHKKRWCECVMSHACESWHMWMSHVSCVWVMFHVYESCLMWMSRVSCELVIFHVNESCLIWMSHGSCRIWTSHVTYDWHVPWRIHIWMSHGTHTNRSCYTYEWVMSHTYPCVTSYMIMSHVTHMHESFRRCAKRTLPSTMSVRVLLWAHWDSQVVYTCDTNV